MTRPSSKVLVVEDEQDVRDFLVLHLKREGHEVTAIHNGDEASRLLSENKYDIALFDWMIPGMTGLELCRRFSKDVPVLMVTARAETADIVLGLEAGADDYITKPFEVPVLLARVRSVMRRRSDSFRGSTTFQIGELFLDIGRHEVKCSGDSVNLTPSEFGILSELMKNAGRVMSRERLMKCIAAADATPRLIDTHVFELRKKLGECASAIITIRGVGYRIEG